LTGIDVTELLFEEITLLLFWGTKLLFCLLELSLLVFVFIPYVATLIVDAEEPCILEDPFLIQVLFYNTKTGALSGHFWHIPPFLATTKGVSLLHKIVLYWLIILIRSTS